ncbi:hypothetical protein BJ138DRAFT_1151703 [Hygrophoropsis aurantiaca]|uniref:Uncharacterized protein n=1 Tax=Hygrophoropsis aurantiaca TaxID=72124 RepID=A0ACB8AC04_9AGAM|nr:hypothetical protein BJ138DRAFT_1151703 [Hygrophoropsis aurantiaca]
MTTLLRRQLPSLSPPKSQLATAVLPLRSFSLSHPSSRLRCFDSPPRLLSLSHLRSLSSAQRALSSSTLRSFSSSTPRPAPSPTLPKAATILVRAPTPAQLEAAEIDLEPIPPEHVSVVLTDRAAEQLRTIALRAQDPGAALRITVESGGCHGYQYKMELAGARGEDDYHFTHPHILPSNLYIDATSLGLLNGATLDYATELIGSAFRVAENPQAKGSGCGCGVSWELKE